MLGRGAANLIIRDKRSDGYVEKDAWGLDFPMTNLDRARSLPTVFQNAESQAPEWSLDNVMPIPEIKAAILAAQFSALDMDLGEWTQETSYWKEVQPPGFQMHWLKHYDGRPDEYGAILSADRISANPSWGLRFLRARAPDGQTEAIGIAVTLNALGTVQYQLYLPQDEGWYPELYWSDDSGATWSLVDTFASQEAGRWAAGAFERADWIACIHLPDRLVIYLGDISTPWIYYEKGLDIPEGHVRIEVTGGQAAFHFGELEYAAEGTIARNLWITPPSRLNDEAADTVQYLGSVPDGTSIEVTMEADEETPPNVYPKAVLTGGARTPVLHEVQATRPAVHAAPVTTLLFDNLAVEADKTKVDVVEYCIAQGWRGSWLRARLRTAGEYDLTGNEKAQVKVALDIGEGLEWFTQVTGYLGTPRREKDGDDPGIVWLEIEARDRLCRLQNKAAKLLPSFDGWSFGGAWTWLMHECAGIPEADILLDDGAADWILPIRGGGMGLKFDQTLDIVSVADQLAAAAGRRWGVDQDGCIFTDILGSNVYSGTPDYTLDEDAAGEDMPLFIEFERDLFALRNHVICIGQDADGSDVMASWRCENSISDPDNDPFIGDEWCQVVIAPEGGDPWLIAQFTGSELAQYRGLLVWQTNGKPDLFPGHFVAVNTSGLGIAEGTVFEIIEKWGRLDAQSGEFINKFLVAII